MKLTRIVTVIPLASIMLATAGVASADVTDQHPTLKFTPSTVKSSHGTATFTVSGRNWKDPAYGRCAGQFKVSLSLRTGVKGTLVSVLGTVVLPTGKSSFEKKISAKIKPGQYQVQGTFECVQKTSTDEDIGEDGAISRPLTVT